MEVKGVEKNKLNILNKFFSRNTFRHCYEEGYDKIYGQVIKKYINYDLITYVEDRKGHDRRYAIAPDKIKKEIGWEPETMFKEGIRKTINWYFEHQEWMEHVTSGDYQKYYDSMYHIG